MHSSHACDTSNVFLTTQGADTAVPVLLYSCTQQSVQGSICIRGGQAPFKQVASGASFEKGFVRRNTCQVLQFGPGFYRGGTSSTTAVIKKSTPRLYVQITYPPRYVASASPYVALLLPPRTAP